MGDTRNDKFWCISPKKTEDSGLMRCDAVAVCLLVLQSDMMPSSLRVEESKRKNIWTDQLLQMKGLCSFRKSANANPVTLHHLTEDLNPQQNSTAVKT